MAAPPQPQEDRRTRREALCVRVFAQVDSARRGCLDQAQTKAGLKKVFEQLGDVPLPKEGTCQEQFRNFDREGKGYIDLSGFREIVVQWDDYQQEKRKKATASAAPQADANGARPRGPAAPPAEEPKLASARRAPAASINPDVMFPTKIGYQHFVDDYEAPPGVIGRGSYGSVKVVRHRRTMQVRACKVLRADGAVKREMVGTEITMLKSLNHPNIMKMHEVYFEYEGDEQNQNIYLITELCEGGDLFTRILYHQETLKQPMTESLVVFMMKQILAAVKYCHSASIIHRDMKPENILFTTRKSSSPLKVIDFGLAGFMDKIREQAMEVQGCAGRGRGGQAGAHSPRRRGTTVMQMAGTPHYMAPEMIEGHYDEAADLFSIGIILSQLLSGWHPFYTPGDGTLAIQKKIVAAQPVEFPAEPWRPISAPARELCAKLLEKDPAKRLSAAQAYEHPWLKDPAKPSPYGNEKDLSASVFDGLKQYQESNILKKAVLQLLTIELSEWHIQELRSKFMALDAQGDGFLEREELLEGMRQIGYATSNAELEKLLAAMDASGKKRIGYREFLAALIHRKVKIDRQSLWEIFKKFDKKNCGRVTYEDMISKINITKSVFEETAEETARGTDDAEPQKSLELTFEQFVALMEQDRDPDG